MAFGRFFAAGDQGCVMRKALYSVLVVAAIATVYMLGRSHATQVVSASSSRRILYYVDPMHPSYKSDKPGIAPDCGMKLEPVYADTAAPTAAVREGMPAGTVQLDARQQQLAGVQVVPVETSAGTHASRLLGRVTADDTRVYRLNAAVDGWIRQTYDDGVGSRVKKNQRLADMYSPDFIVFENNHLAAAERGQKPMQQFVRSVEYSADRLRDLGMSDLQIAEITKTKQIPDSVYIVSPVDGFIIARNVSSGLRFAPHTEFYRIADLSRVWIMAEIFENEAQYFRPGAVAQITLPGQHQVFRARISNILPQVDPATRTLKLRLEADNPGFALRPDMFVDIELPVPASPGLTVPRDALVDFGKAQRVFVDRGNGVFEPRKVETGWEFGDRVQIVKGLAAGERVVAAGTFLLDSESRLRAAKVAQGSQ
jgi:RND family efflux transporter MFP subunit